MARPWRMQPWPYERKDGLRSYRVGYRDHKKGTRSKSFPTAHSARSWMSDYIAAERRGPGALMVFLDDAQPPSEARVLGEVVTLYLAHNRPEDEGGLAPSTFHNFRALANRHLLGHEGYDRRFQRLPPWPHAQKVAMVPAMEFNGPDAPRAFHDALVRAGISLSVRDHAWVVLSSCLSWAARSALVPEVRTNGCLLANERRTSKRRSARRGGSGVSAERSRIPRQGARAGSWALSALAIEHIRRHMLRREEQRSTLLPHRDAIVTSLQFGLGARNQEVFALRWGNVRKETVEILEALAWGSLDEGKTYSSTPRMTTLPSVLAEDLDAWKRVLKQHGRSTRPEDFIIAGDLAGASYGVPDPRTGACHFTRNQSQKWSSKYFRPAVEAVAEGVKGMEGIAGATEYALRRGCITARLRAEDPQIVAGECGTSLVMLDRHYSFALAEHRREPGRPLDIVWREAREKVTGKAPKKRRLHAVA